MKKYGLVGKDISHSFSPQLHTIIANIFNVEMEYQLIDLPKLNINYLKQFNGFSITKPYKIDMFNIVTNKTEVASSIGAINTVYYKDNEMIGENTDYYGFKYLIESNNIDVTNKRIAILGTGGASLVCQYYLKDKTNYIYFVSRNKTGEQTILYDDFDNHNFDIIINATPIGSGSSIGESPLRSSSVSNKIVIDLNYNPSTTKLMSFSNKSYNGLEMLIVQALYAQKLWHGDVIQINQDIINQIKEQF